MYHAKVEECRYLTSPRVRLLFPWYVLRSLVQREAATLERAYWLGLGFAVYGIARKTVHGDSSYVLSA